MLGPALSLSSFQGPGGPPSARLCGPLSRLLGSNAPLPLPEPSWRAPVSGGSSSGAASALGSFWRGSSALPRQSGSAAMVGKAVSRRRLHQARPQLAGRGRDWAPEDPPARPSATLPAKDQGCLPSSIFAGVMIDPKTLVNKLDTDSRSIVSMIKGEEEKTILPKKEKMKLRKEKWLQKIEGIKLAKRKQQAEAKRKATPVIGDMHPLMEALPELSDLATVSNCCQQPKIQIKKMVLLNFNQMKPAQKSKVLEEEITQFHKTITDPSFKANPLTVIGEHLSKRLKQEREGKPL